MARARRVRKQQPRQPARERRSRAELVPSYTDAQARAAVAEIRRLRADAKDPALRFFPDLIPGSPDITEDVAAVIRYLAGPQRLDPAVRDEIRRAELPHRAVLVEWLHQQREAQYRRQVIEYDRQVLAVLDAGHDLGAPYAVFGTALGYPTRQAVWNRRNALRTMLDAHDHHLDPPRRRPTDPATGTTTQTDDPRTQAWLDEHRRDLIDISGDLVDQRDKLLELLPIGEHRDWLAEAIDLVGQSLSTRPTVSVAAAIAYAMFLLRIGGPASVTADPMLRDLLDRGTRLRVEFNALSR